MFPFVLMALYACGGMAAYDNIGGGTNTPVPDDTDPPDTDAAAETDEPAIDTALPPPDGTPDTALPPPVTDPGDGGGDPTAPITLQDIAKAYNSGQNARQTMYRAPIVGADPCRGLVNITVSTSGQFVGNGACTWPLLAPAAVIAGDFDTAMTISITGEVQQNNPTMIRANRSTITFSDSTSSTSVNLGGEFSRDGSGNVQLEIWHDGWGPKLLPLNAQAGFSSRGNVLLR